MPMYDPFALKSNPINEGIRTYGMLQDVRLREEEAAARQEDRAANRELRGMQMKATKLQLQGAERQERQTQDLEALRGYRQEIDALVKGGGGNLKLRDPSHAEVFQRYGLAVNADAVEIPNDEPGMIRALGAVSPAYYGLDAAGVKKVADAFADIDHIMRESQKNPDVARSLGLVPDAKGRIAIDREKNPEVFASLETALGRQVNKGDGGKKALYGAYIDLKNGSMAFEVEVEGADGKKYTAPITLNRGTADDDPIRLVPLAGFAGYVNANAELGKRLYQTLADLGDAGAAETLKEMRAGQKNQAIGQALAGIAGFTPEEGKSLSAAVAAGADAKDTATMILEARKRSDVELVWRDNVNIGGQPYHVAFDKKSGKEVARIPQWVKDADGGSGTGGKGGGKLNADAYKLFDDQLNKQFLAEYLNGLPEDQRSMADLMESDTFGNQRVAMERVVAKMPAEMRARYNKARQQGELFMADGGVTPIQAANQAYQYGNQAGVQAPGAAGKASPFAQIDAKDKASVQKVAQFLATLPVEEYQAAVQEIRQENPGLVESLVAQRRTGEGRPIVQNRDGSISTERTITIGIDGEFVNIPTMYGGKEVSGDEAVEIARKNGWKDPETGRSFAFYPTQQAAEAAARQRSDSLGQKYGRQGMAPPASSPVQVLGQMRGNLQQGMAAGGYNPDLPVELLGKGLAALWKVAPARLAAAGVGEALAGFRQWAQNRYRTPGTEQNPQALAEYAKVNPQGARQIEQAAAQLAQ